MTFRLGWVGCGRQAHDMLLPHLATLDDVRLTALADIDPEALSKTAASYGVQATYTDYVDLLEHRPLDGIGMAVGPRWHEEIAIAALKRGLPVFVEKPPAADLAGAQAIARAAEKAKKPALVGFMKRYSSGNRIARNLLDGEGFGERLGITASYMTAPTYFESDPDYSGFFLHHCIHYLDLVPWLMSSAIDDVFARQAEHAPGKLLMHLSLAFETGAIGTLVMGTMQSRGAPVEFIQIMGDHRRIEIANVTGVTYHRDPAFKSADPNATLVNGSDSLCWTPNMTVAANEDHKGYRALLDDSLKAMRGEPSSAPTIEDGVRAMATLERLKAALTATSE